VDKSETRIIELCEDSVARLAEALPEAEVGGLLRAGETLRHVAHAGRLRVIYEVQREQGGVAWRAVELRETQLVEDVRRDPDYLASDECVQSEIAAPVAADDEIVLVLDVEFPGRVFSSEEIAAVEDEAERLGRVIEDVR